ncbi:phytanoyl-CoA dioxygenase family protein [Nannocystis pusilla]|uniref:phytanoyl-CoA dioxygenase family protein n=1 Tax=Nannocystis pusilla TaxID=889268 RepID=UPI003BF08336
MDEREMVTEADRRAFADDGVVCLRQRFDATWVERLRRAQDEMLAVHHPQILNFTAPGNPGRYAMGLFLWRLHPVFREFVFESPAAEIAARVLGSRKINLLHDKMLIKEPGTTERTFWHQDLFFWPVEGAQICSIWLALDRVTQETGGVEFIAGSNHWPERYRPRVPDGLWHKRNMHLPPCPDFDATHRVLRWDLEPGDCLVFDSIVMHGSGGNTSSDVRRRAHATHWCGDDVTYVDGDFILELPVSPGLATGDPLDSEVFPVVRREDRSS